MVVLLGYTNTFTRTNQWQNQAQYEMGHNEVCGFRQIEERTGEAEFVLYYGSKTPKHTRILFQGLFEKFLRSRDVIVAKYPPVICAKCGYRQERVEVVKRIKAGKNFLFCGECSANISLTWLNEELELSRDERENLEQEQLWTQLKTAFEAALVRVKAFIRDQSNHVEAPKCFISYAWGVPQHERWVKNLATDLKNAGIIVILDQWDNSHIGSSVPRFISEIENSDMVVVVGTPLYKQKYENKVSTTGSIVAAEVDLIHLRLTGTETEKKSVLPLLLEGNDRLSLPALLRGRVYGDFREEKLYFITLLDLILTLYHIPFEHPAFSDLRESVRQGTNTSKVFE